MDDINKRIKEINMAIQDLQIEKQKLISLLPIEEKETKINKIILEKYFEENNIDYFIEDDVYLLTDDFGVRIANVKESQEGVNSSIREKFAEKNIEIVTIFPWHNINKILEFIGYKTNIIPVKRIFARKCEIIEEEINKDVRDFIRENHILDYSQIRNKISAVSLFYNNERVGVSVFIKHGQTNNVAELKRQVFKDGISVVGGSSRMISFFEKSHPEINEIITFSDLDLSGLNVVYNNIGFDLIGIDTDKITWYNPELDKKFSNVSLFMVGADRLLKNDPGYIPYGIGENLPSNQEIVESHGYLRVYDTGYAKWKKILKNK